MSNITKLPKATDLFGTTDLDSHVEIPIRLIDNFKDHPFIICEYKVEEIADSIATNGLITPVTVRKKDDRYEMIAGHTRLSAVRSLGHDMIKAHIKELSDDEATILMVDSNKQREALLPSERAKAYTMLFGAEKRQGKRTDLTSDMMSEVSESQKTIRRYIQLGNLIVGLLEKVDKSDLSVVVGVELSKLSKKNQRELFLFLRQNPTEKVSLKQAKAITEMKTITFDALYELFEKPTKEKINKGETIIISYDAIKHLIPADVNIIGYIIEALEDYDKRALPFN